MQSDAKKTFYYHADANSLGGFIEKPFPRIVPSQASASLPPVGGQVTSRTEAFNFEEIVSCRSAYTRVAGSQIAQGGPWAMTITSVVEDLNILEVITADRLVAQVSFVYETDGSYLVSLAGSRYEGLRLGGCDASPTLNPSLLCGPNPQLTLAVLRQTGREQAGKMIRSVEADQKRGDLQWVIDRFGWMAADRDPEEDACVLCSLVDGVDPGIPGTAFGHAVELPDFGRIFLGELLVCRSSIQVTLIRAELGCAQSGTISAACAAGIGSTVPP